MIRVAVLTVSDSTVAGTREDQSGPALSERCRALGWRVTATQAVPDEIVSIAGQLQLWADGGETDVIITTGGTGVALRDVTPEATRLVIDREIEGFGELMRARGAEQTRFAALSRGLAGTRGRTLIVNVPGAPSGAVFSLNAVEHLVLHVTQLLSGHTEHVV